MIKQQTPFHIKERDFLNLIKNIYKTPATNIILMEKDCKLSS